MKFYIDDLTHSNLHLLSANDLDPRPLTFDNINSFHDFANAGFEIAQTKEYTSQGIYLVSVQGYAESWSGKANPRHILYEIPLNVIQAAKDKKILIVIDNQSEGFPLIREKANGFFEMHEAMKNLRLPKFSVVLVDSNAQFNTQYSQWCIENYQIPILAHTYFLTGFFYFHNRIPDYPLVLDALKSNQCKEYNSLNRTVRPHRTDHLYYLIKENLIQHGLVSGNYTNNPENRKTPTISKSLILNAEHNNYVKTLVKNLPRIVDKDFTVRSPDTDNKTIFNYSIYKNSLLSFVTETAFHQPGMFITEKTFKPIVAGHPFIILGQYNILKELNRMGYRTDFDGIDQSYDDIIDPIDRFYAAHLSLIKWVNTSRAEKELNIQKSLEIIKHNQKNYKKYDYVYESHKRLYETVQEIFSGKYRQR